MWRICGGLSVAVKDALREEIKQTLTSRCVGCRTKESAWKKEAEGQDYT